MGRSAKKIHVKPTRFFFSFLSLRQISPFPPFPLSNFALDSWFILVVFWALRTAYYQVCCRFTYPGCETKISPSRLSALDLLERWLGSCGCGEIQGLYRCVSNGVCRCILRLGWERLGEIVVDMRKYGGSSVVVEELLLSAVGPGC